LWQSALAGRLSRAIHIEDEVMVPLPVKQPAWLFLFFQRARTSVFEKQGTQWLDCWLIQRGEKAAEGRACWQVISPEECHERVCPGLEMLIKGFQRSFAADCITEENGNKIDYLLASEAAAGKTHLLFYGAKHPLAL
jgi:hypothetical protein